MRGRQSSKPGAREVMDLARQAEALAGRCEENGQTQKAARLHAVAVFLRDVGEGRITPAEQLRIFHV